MFAGSLLCEHTQGEARMPRTSDEPDAGPGRGARVWLRPALEWAIVALCVVFAAAVLWSWLTPEVLARVGAAPLVALVALFVLPALVTWLARVDRRLNRAPADDGAEPAGVTAALRLAPARSARAWSPAAPRPRPVGATNGRRTRRLSA